jgi:hypothetical protein
VNIAILVLAVLALILTVAAVPTAKGPQQIPGLETVQGLLAFAILAELALIVLAIIEVATS